MAVTSTYNSGTKISVETDRGSAPSGVKNGKLWSEGGRWFDVITEGYPTVQDTQAMIFPQGHAGDRRINQQVPVVGRQWSDGQFKAPIVADFLGALLYGAFGSLSSNMVPSSSPTGGSLTVNEPLAGTDKLLSFNQNGVLTQPGDGGAILRFELKGIQGPGYVTIYGIDAYGNGASETVGFPAAGLAYSRTSFSSVGASGLSVHGLSAGNLTVIGIRNFTHTFTQASVAPTFSFERIGNPTAGEASANKNFITPANVLKTLTFTIDAEKVDAIATVDAVFEGDPSGGSTKTTINAPSMLRVWPAWDLSITRDNGATWNVVENVTLTINTGNTNYRAAAGTQGPQGSFYGATEYLGNITILLNNEVEYNKWKGASEIKMFWSLQTPWILAGSTFYNIAASVPAFLNKVAVTDTNGMFTLTGDYRVVRDDTFPMSMALTNSTQGQAYSLITSI
jgi:hypothetical protein